MGSKEPLTTANRTQETLVCYAPTLITTNGIWQGDNPLDYSLPLFILQLTLVVATTRFLVFALKPLRQPRVVSEILGGVLLGPSVLGRSKAFSNAIFPLRSVMVLETMANVGLLYFLFLVGVEMDISVIKRTGKRALAVAVSGMLLPFIVGLAFAFVIHKDSGGSSNTSMNQGSLILLLGVTLSVTAFPVLARILAELKLINTELGRFAMSSALLNDICAWILLAFAIALAEHKSASLASLWVVIASAAFVVFCIFVVRPFISCVIRRTPEGETFSEFYLCVILTGVMMSGFITDAIGTHSVFGAFVFGLVIPNGSLGVTLIEKLEDFVSGLLLPLFFAMSGLKTNIAAINGTRTWGMLFIVIILGSAGKIAGTMLITMFYKMPLLEGFTLGVLMNTKGLVEMIVLNVGKDQKVLDDQAFAIMVIAAVAMTGIIPPIITTIYRPARRLPPYKRRTIQSSKADGELRVLVCVHSPRNVPAIINLLEATNPTKKSPLGVYVLHLVELTGRASAMLIVHNTQKAGRPAINRTQAQSDHIINAFENYEQHAGFVTVQPLTAFSPYSTMHEDICNLAEEKRVAFIIIPFHKQQTVDGGMEATNPAFRMINQNVLANAPCSVGILVDRGLNGSTSRILAANNNIQTCQSHHIAVLFFGGPDDREALSYASRMSEHPGIMLTVLRFIPSEEATIAYHHQLSRQKQHSTSSSFSTTSSSSSRSHHHNTNTENSNNDNNNNDNKDAKIKIMSVETDIERKREKQLDEEHMNQFKMLKGNDESVLYVEKVMNDGEETVAEIRSMDNSHDLFIVGRGRGMTESSPLTASLTDWSECPELGAIGDFLASSDFATTVSVLVVQQSVVVHGPAGGLAEDTATPDHPDSPGPRSQPMAFSP